MNSKGSTLITIILVVILTLLLVFIFYGKKMGSEDFSIQDVNKDVFASESEGESFDETVSEPEPDLNDVDIKLEGYITGLNESNFSDKNISLEGDVEFTYSDSMKVSLKDPDIIGFSGTVAEKDGSLELVGYAKEIKNETTSLSNTKKKVMTRSDTLFIKNVFFTIEASGIDGELRIDSRDFNLSNGYLKVKDYSGNLDLEGGKYNLDGYAEYIKVNQDGKLVSFG